MIFVYSGEVPKLDQYLLKKLPYQHKLLVIPYSPDQLWVGRESVDYFEDAGISAAVLKKWQYRDPVELRHQVMQMDAVFLSGGNTYEFLDYARQVGLFDILMHFERAGGIIVTESAGSIILSPDISTAGMPDSFADDNDIGLTDLTGMGRLPFHFHPHHEPDSPDFAAEMAQLHALAEQSQQAVFLIEDGQGLVFDESDRVVFTVGRVEQMMPSGVPESSELAFLDAVRQLPAGI